ncbi:MAG TPA: hypothetical protein VIR78_12180 [Malonomonas sp.]
MKLLREIAIVGAPDDYLYARIRSRRAALDTSGRGSWSGPAEPRLALRAEYRWVYSQLNQRSRRKLLPLFEYAELRTLVIALRYLAAEEHSEKTAQLQLSLLQPQLRKLLLGTEPISVVLSALQRMLAADYPYFSGLLETYLRQGPGGLEQALLGGCLQRAVKTTRCRPVRELLVYLLDMRNLLAVYKHLHWQVTAPPPLLSGGELETALLKKIWAAGDLSGLLNLVVKRAGQPGDPEKTGVEDFLLQGLSSKLRRGGREPLQLALLLDYLWRCQLAARNRGLLLSDAVVPVRPLPVEVAK